MRRKVILICVILSFICITRNLSQQDDPLSYVELGAIPDAPNSDAEGLMTVGARAPFSKTGVFELELITGISDGLAQSILGSRAAIAEQAAALPDSSRYRAFTLARGIGQKRAKVLYSVIDPTS